MMVVFLLAVTAVVLVAVVVVVELAVELAVAVVVLPNVSINARDLDSDRRETKMEEMGTSVCVNSPVAMEEAIVPKPMNPIQNQCHKGKSSVIKYQIR